MGIPTGPIARWRTLAALLASLRCFRRLRLRGTYEPTVTGAGESLAVVNGSALGHVVVVVAPNVTLERVWVRNSGTYATAHDAALRIEAPDVTVRESRLTRFQYGVWVEGVDRVAVVNNTVVGHPGNLIVRPGHGSSMDFGFTDTQQMVRDELRDFVENRIIGENNNWDDDEHFPTDVYDDMADLGLLGLHLPEEAGGEDFSPVTAGVVYEEIGRGDVGLATPILAENLANKLIWDNGNEAQRDLVRRARRGETHTCFALTEPEQGSDAQNLDSTVESTDDGWLVNGEKTAITGATRADHCYLIARQTGPGSDIQSFLVPLDADGVEVQPYAGLGCEVSGWGQIFLDDVKLPQEARLGEENAFKLAMQTFDRSRAWIALFSLGCAQRTLDETATYLTEREAMGKPLAAYEGPQFEFAEQQTMVEVARLKAYETLWRAMEGREHTRDAAMAKWIGPEVAVETVRKCLVLHGHYGYSDDFGIGKRLRDVVGQQIADGTPHVQKLIVARETFGREYLPYDR